MTASGQVRLDDLLRVCSSEDTVNEGLLHEMVLLFIQENGRRIRTLVDAAADGDQEALRHHVHAVKGSAAIVGADLLRQLASDIEAAVISGTLRDASASIRALDAEYEAVVATLRALYPDLGAT